MDKNNITILVKTLFNVHVIVLSYGHEGNCTFDKYSSIGTSYTKNKIWQRHKVTNVRTGGKCHLHFALVYFMCEVFVCVCLVGWLDFCLIATRPSLSPHSCLESFFFFSHI